MSASTPQDVSVVSNGTHDYDTMRVRVSILNSDDTLVGESGGLSSIYEVVPWATENHYAIKTEHGTLYLDPDQEVEVLDEPGPKLTRLLTEPTVFDKPWDFDIGADPLT